MRTDDSRSFLSTKETKASLELCFAKKLFKVVITTQYTHTARKAFFSSQPELKKQGILYIGTAV